VIDSNQYGEGVTAAAGVVAIVWVATFAVEDEAKADEALPVGSAYITAGAKEEVADETADETWRMETWSAATGLIALSRAIAR
jgi:hypothetical protein